MNAMALRRRPRRVLLVAFLALAGASLIGGAVAGARTSHSWHRDHHGVIPAAAGIVVATPASGAASFTIQTRGGSTDTVDVNGSTSYYERGVASAGLGDVIAGDRVAVLGTASGSTIDAVVVLIGRHATVGGVVGATPGAAATSFTITTLAGGTATIDVTSATRYFELGTGRVSLAQVMSGDAVRVRGRPAAGDTVTASAVLIVPAPAGGGALVAGGTVQTDPSRGSFVIETRGRTQVTVDTSASTTYLQRRDASASLVNVSVGERVAVFGTRSGSTVTATQIAIVGARWAFMRPGVGSGRWSGARRERERRRFF